MNIRYYIREGGMWGKCGSELLIAHRTGRVAGFEAGFGFHGCGLLFGLSAGMDQVARRL